MRLLLTVTSCWLVLSLNAQMIGLTVEIDTVFYEAIGPHPTTPDLLLFEDLDGYVTYDVYANLTNETDEVIAIYSDVEGLGVAPMFIDAPCGCFNPNFGAVLLGGSQNDAFFSVFPEIEYDTYWTIDLNDTEQSLIFNPAYSSASMCSEIVEDGSIFVLPDNANAAGDDLRIKIARVTTCGGFSLSACFNVFVGGDNSNVQDYCIDENGSGPFFVSEGGIYGCTDELALNFDPTAFENDGSCTYSGAEYCGPGTIWDSATLKCLPSPNNCGAGTYWNQLEAQCLPFDNCPEDLDNDGNVAVPDLLILLSAYSEECPAVLGCTDMEAVNFNPNAQEDDGSCILTVLGCTLEAACNYSGLANLDDGTCLFEDECGVCGGGGLLDGACDCEGNFSVDFYDCDGECLFDSDGDGVCDELEVLGCTDSDAANFDSTATDDDGSCVTQGCTFPTACNYNPAADEDDGTCQSFDQCGVCGGSGFPLGTCNCEGTPPDSGYDCYGECLNDIDGDGVCDQFEVIGCDDSIACNYQANATDNDGSCVFPDEFYDCDGICLSDGDGDGVCDELEVGGCVDASACNYSNDATDDDGSCFYAQEFYDCLENCLGDVDGDGVCDELEVSGCTDTEAFNFEQDATEDNGSCAYAGCTVSIACNYNPLASVDDDSCEFYCPGCTDDGACNYDDGAIQDDGTCLFPEDFWGGTYFDCEGNCAADLDGDGVCDEDEIVGCQLEGACNYLAGATDEGECEYESCVGCTYEFACNYDPQATIADNGSCEFGTCPGCTDPEACNYNPTVTEDDGSCEFPDECGVCFGDNSTCFMSCGDLLPYEGHDYATVQIGDQCWFAENLRNEHYANGDAIPGDLSDGEWWSTTDGAMTVYGEGTSPVSHGSDDEVSNLADYGRLYNWYAVDDARGLCPSGWHVPTDGEYTTLTDGLGGTSVAGGKMKSSAQDSPSWDGTNTSGFSGLAGGYRYNSGDFGLEGYYGCFWSASAYGTGAWPRILDGSNTEVYRNNYNQRFGFSVRCVRD